jgi:hypothetical protein
MLESVPSGWNTLDPEAVAFVLIFLALLTCLFTAGAYVFLKAVLKFFGRVPTAIHLKDVKPGNVLLNESMDRGYVVKVKSVTLDIKSEGGGTITTTQEETIRVPQFHLVLIA